MIKCNCSLFANTHVVTNGLAARLVEDSIWRKEIDRDNDAAKKQTRDSLGMIIEA